MDWDDAAMTSLEKAHKWLSENAIAFRSGDRDVSLAKLLDDEAEAIASWLRGLESCLQREARRTGDPQLVARLGIYEGIASEVVGGNWKRVTSTMSSTGGIKCVCDDERFVGYR